MFSKKSQPLENTDAYSFGEFTFNIKNKVLFRDENVITLPPKACELLCELLKNAGQIITREDLLERVWSETFVEEANLTHHISALRKALGEDNKGRKFIETIPRKGYRFIAPLKKNQKRRPIKMRRPKSF